jgi:hypothetical protein
MSSIITTLRDMRAGCSLATFEADLLAIQKEENSSGGDSPPRTTHWNGGCRAVGDARAEWPGLTAERPHFRTRCKNIATRPVPRYTAASSLYSAPAITEP